MDVQNLLKEWGMSAESVANFEKSEIDMLALRHIDDQTIKELISTHGQRIRFQIRHAEWVKSQSSSNEVVFELVDNNGNKVSPENVVLENRMLVVDDAVPDIIMSGDESTVNPGNGPAAKERTNSPCQNFIIEPSLQPEISGKTSGMVDTSVDVKSSSENVGVVRVTQARAVLKSYDLEAILKSSTKGKVILRSVCGGKLASESVRNDLAEIIIDNELNNDEGKLLHRDRLELLGKAVVTLFKEENLDDWFYVHKSPATKKHTIKGKLVCKYHNTRRKFYDCGLLQKKCEGMKLPPEESLSEAEKKSLDGSLLWLEKNSSPWDQVLNLWASTAKFRMLILQNDRDGESEGQVDEAYKEMTVQDYFKKYRAFHEDLGYQLFEKDFAHLYPDVGSLAFFDEWASLSSFLQEELRTKDPEFLKDAVYTPQETILKTLLSFSKVFPTVTVRGNPQASKKKGKSKASRKQWRPSKAEVQDAFFFNVPSIPKLYESLDERRVKLKELKLTLQPMVALVGPVEDSTQICVIVDDFFYNLTCPLKAIDICFKAFHALHTPYPVEAEQLWLFLQKTVYRFNTEFDNYFTGVSTLVGKYLKWKKELVTRG